MHVCMYAGMHGLATTPVPMPLGHSLYRASWWRRTLAIQYSSRSRTVATRGSLGTTHRGLVDSNGSFYLVYSTAGDRPMYSTAGDRPEDLLCSEQLESVLSIHLCCTTNHKRRTVRCRAKRFTRAGGSRWISGDGSLVRFALAGRGASCP